MRWPVVEGACLVCPFAKIDVTSDMQQNRSRFLITGFPFLACRLCPLLCLLCLFCLSVKSQTVLNVTNFRASGDAIRFFVNTVSNSTVVSVAGTNTFSSADVGKVIEVFRAGPWVTYKDWGPVVTQQDIICLVKNVSNGTNLSLTVPCGWTMKACCVMGTNNAPAFQAVIKAASKLVGRHKQTNVTIYIPSGTYLMVSPYVLDNKYVMSGISDTHPVITVSSGGITFLGESATNTILMGCGAGMEHLVGPGLSWISSGYAPCVPMRDTLVECVGPVAHRQYLLVFENLTFDGGVLNGAQSYNYFTPIQGNGEGWDTTHHAVADTDPQVTCQMNQMKVFTNCIFQHWRGEMLICWTGDVPDGFNDIANCTFYDGNATADNMYYGQHIHGCVFNQIEKVTEYYQANASLPTVFENNLITNIDGNILVINGATTSAVPPSYTICNNVFWGKANLDDILFTPAENVTISNNVFHGQAVGISFSAAGLQPANGTAAVMSNVVIVANSFNDTFLPIVTDGYPVMDVLVSNNSSAGTYSFAIGGGGWKTNWVFADNTAPTTLNSTEVAAGQYFVDMPSDHLGWYIYNDWTGVANRINYGNGWRHLILHGTTNSVFELVSSSLIPAAARLLISNASPATVSLLSGPSLQPGQSAHFSWANGEWHQE